MKIPALDLVTIGCVFVQGTMARSVEFEGEIGIGSFVGVVETRLKLDVVVAGGIVGTMPDNWGVGKDAVWCIDEGAGVEIGSKSD